MNEETKLAENKVPDPNLNFIFDTPNLCILSIFLSDVDQVLNVFFQENKRKSTHELLSILWKCVREAFDNIYPRKDVILESKYITNILLLCVILLDKLRETKSVTPA